ncbi:MAG: BrnT family toxin [SAR202 cluster bacterium]|nr:BrnT family toxin [SAR202 cluster bacterium]
MKHGVDFAGAAAIFDGPITRRVDNRLDYGEKRYVATGAAGTAILAVVYTMRGDICRIISARKAHGDERQRYQDAVGRGEAKRYDRLGKD